VERVDEVDTGRTREPPYNLRMAGASSPELAWRGVAAGALVVACLLGSLALAGRSLGRETDPAWVCDDTRLTQLVPRGRAVVGGTVSLPPGCGPR
jgi:hypothetical protein